jgi:hypothetical protein
MFPFPIATPQGCNIQTFYGVPSGTNKLNFYMWNKPVGVSHVYMMLIGAGGNAPGGSAGGGSGAVTVWYGAAQHVPNNLQVQCGSGENASEIRIIRGGSGGTTVILQALAGQSDVGGLAASAPAFAASGFYKSTAGQDGTSGNVSASATTFLSGGGGSTSSTVTANYGYSLTAATTNLNGTFLMQPIIVGLGGKGTGIGGIGCGGGRDASGGNGGAGPGMVLIASW